MKVIQIAVGRFHHFHLARQLERHGLLQEIWTGYPRFKLRSEPGIPVEKIRTFPWLQAGYMAAHTMGLGKYRSIEREWAWLANNTLDKYVTFKLNIPGVLIALSGSGRWSGKKMQSLGGLYICDRGSTHIVKQNEILAEEYSSQGINYEGIDPRMIEKELAEYEQANTITVPSEFVRNSFLEKGVPAEKIHKIPYGVNLARFRRVLDPDNKAFHMLWVGAVSIRKGFLYALDSFNRLKHPRKIFTVIGAMTKEMRLLLKGKDLARVRFLGRVPSEQLPEFYSRAHVFLLTSVEEGLGIVMGEALACGCPVIATVNTGATDLFSDGVEGFIVPIRSADVIAEKLQELADDTNKLQSMSEAALRCVQGIGGWNAYGDQYIALIREVAG